MKPRLAALSIAGALGLLVGTVGPTACGTSSSPAAGGSTMWSCSGRPDTFPLDDLAQNKMPDSFVSQVSATLSTAMTSGEIRYLNELGGGHLNADNVYTDPVLRKAVAALQPLVSQDCSTLTMREWFPS